MEQIIYHIKSNHTIVTVLFALLLTSCEIFADESAKTKVLWIGTSIPQGCTYPSVSCDNLGLKCGNKAIGSSFVREEDLFKRPPFEKHFGLSLSLSSNEKENIYRKYVESGELSENMLENWKNSSYDRCILKYIKDTDILVFDHGYNDGDILADEVEKIDSIDWDSEDRHTFIGAFNFLYKRIINANPNVRIIVGGYFQNKCTMRYTIRGKYLSILYEKIAEHYNLPLLDVWNYVNIPDGYIPNSAEYLDSLNSIYGTSFTKVFCDENGNISYFQKFCPDGVHPFTDPTGNSNQILNDVVTKLLSNIITESSVQEPKIDDTTTLRGGAKIFNKRNENK